MRRSAAEGSLTRLIGSLAIVLTSLGAALAAERERGTRASTDGDTRTITLHTGRSEVIPAPWLVKRVSVTNPEVADVQALSPDKILIQGKSIGSTDVFLWSEQEDVWRARVDVMVDLERMEKTLARTFPDSTLTVSQTQEVIVVGGSLGRADQAQQLRKLLEASGYPYVDTTELAGVQQVQIQVRVAEVSRTAIRSLGVNAVGIGDNVFGGLTVGPSSGGALNPVSIGAASGTSAVPDVPFSYTQDLIVSPAVTLFGGLTKENVEVFIQALSENQYLRILAEPNLVALSGEEASFLAGGEYPIPVVQGGTANSTSVTIEYREFGVRLRFRPTVLGSNKIRLLVAPEVSEMTDNGAVEIQGFRIPSVITRRAQTTVELRSGQTFAMAGLLSRRVAARNSQVPFLGDLPILGPLFRSMRYESGETELVVLVTATLVEPMEAGEGAPAPGSFEISESDWSIFLDGSRAGVVPATPPYAKPALFKGLDLGSLRGPGTWTRHDRAAARSEIIQSSWVRERMEREEAALTAAMKSKSEKPAE